MFASLQQPFCRSGESCWRRVCLLLNGHLTFSWEGSCTPAVVSMCFFRCNGRLNPEIYACRW
jgi:hypothetical protein